jgi:hypothetical protein
MSFSNNQFIILNRIDFLFFNYRTTSSTKGEGQVPFLDRMAISIEER